MIEIHPYSEFRSARASSVPPMKISATMALDSLREQVTSTVEARNEYDRQRAVRDDLIRDARTGGIPVAIIMHVTGLSRDRIVKINAATG